ncbi:phage head-tail joining protein [Shinella sp. JR1-6]|uniref:phage head-tail joining protein n=1 Tax=Shinella sp. JR1-6 TaxID=2527671 RepID=UPI00102D3A08|nr:hypothetical protein [Shinella sp. JR1-6]TAA54624.1 hypothetical protein EXZ48_26730 [Shinella sp. JR1-6]
MSGISLDGIPEEERASLLRDLKEAYFLGALRVRFRERDVTYRSRAEMRQIIADLEGAVATAPQRNIILTTFSRGY